MTESSFLYKAKKMHSIGKKTTKYIPRKKHIHTTHTKRQQGLAIFCIHLIESLMYSQSTAKVGKL